MAPQTFGRYEIKEELGRGGMATVYRAYDPSFGREVAAKILPREFLHEATFRARFEREARTIATLEHQAIVPVYDFGEQDGQLFLVMRFMPGGSLAERIAQRPIPRDEVARIIGQLALALDAAHTKGIIHRDLKPANILFDRENNAYLSDFGIAKVAQDTAALTGGSDVIGTPAYMSPEQGRGQPLDWRCDLYSLGVILFQMLSGQLPYRADTPVGMIYAHVHDPIPDILEANAGLPTACADVIRRAMAKEPAERYQTAQEMAAELNAALTSEQLVPAAPPRASMGARHEPLLRQQKAQEIPTELLPGSADSSPRAAKIPPTSGRQRIPAWLWVPGVAVIVCVLGPVGVCVAMSLATPAQETPVAPPVTLTFRVDETTRALAEAGVTRNAGWTPYTEEINGVLMALVPAGCFSMGSNDGTDDEQPIHEVCFEEPYWIDVYEVTQAQITRFYQGIGSAGIFVGENLPREFITLTDAAALCRQRAMRLPTESEWEYAARGPDGLVYPWGNDFVADNAVYSGNSGSKTWAVGSRPGGISWIGAYDLSGNVSEWVSDWYGAYPLTSPQVNPTGPSGGASSVVRGGSWNSADASELRAADRVEIPAGFFDASLGFRCALSY